MKKKKKLPTHDDTPSVPLEPKKIEPTEVNTEGEIRSVKHTDGSKGTPLPPKTIETVTPSYEGEVSKTRNSWENYEEKERTSSLPTTKSGEREGEYPFPHDDIDIYAVDTRIWDRLGSMGGDGGGAPHTHDGLYAPSTHEHPHDHTGDYAQLLHDHPHDHPHDHNGQYAPDGHTHDFQHNHDGSYAPATHAHDMTHDHTEYADAETLAQHLANHPTGDGSGGSYDDTELRGRVGQNETDIDALETENNSQNENISNNTNAIAGKADVVHGHDEFMTLQNQINDKSDKTHTHPPQDTTHNHDGTYQPAGNYANATHDHTNYVKGEGATGLAMWIGSQMDYDAIVSKRMTTLYVVL